MLRSGTAHVCCGWQMKLSANVSVVLNNEVQYHIYPNRSRDYQQK